MGCGLLKDRVAIITGAGQGLGRAIAQEYAREGAAVALVDINHQTVSAVEQELCAQGYTAQAYVLDVSDYDAFRHAITHVARTWERVEIMVNNAAVAPDYRTVLEDSLDNWRNVTRVDLEAVYMGTKIVAPYMVQQRWGRIINIASVQGFLAGGNVGAYNAAKGGVIAFTRSLAVELAPYNIAANAIAPGFMRTPMSIVDGVDETTTEEFMTWYVGHRRIPLARAGQPEDVAGAAVFLASDYCRYMTGQVLVVDGGLSITI